MSNPNNNRDDDLLLGMGEPSDSYVYVDEEGNAIPPEEETSWLMAMGVRGHDSEKPADDGAAQSSDASQPQPMVETQYAEDPTEFEKERKLALDRLQAVLRGEYVQNDGADVVSVEVVEEVDEGMEGVYAFSREATSADEWILEHIMDRRAIRGAKGGSDYKVFYDDFGNKETGMLSDGRMEYLCKWKWYVEPTWETRDLLEDEGYLREMRAFDDEALKDKTAVVKKWSDVHGALIPERVFGNDAPVVALAGMNRTVLGERFREPYMNASSFGCCAKQDAIDRFLATYQRLSETHRPMILYHGTQRTNLYNIATNGLRVPRTQGDDTNGAAHGMGIYAAPSPWTSVGFCGRAGEYCNPYALVTGEPQRRILAPENLISHSLYQPLIRKLSPAQGKAMSKIRNKNILSLNKLAKKSGA